jgi:hypothetical protein
MQGGKMCSICQLFLIWQGLKCPCCSTSLRIKRHDTRTKKRRRIMTKTDMTESRTSIIIKNKVNGPSLIDQLTFKKIF